MSNETPLFTTPPTLMFVGSDPAVADVCARAVPAVKLLRLGHAAGAVQRMLVTRPLVVILDGSVNAEQRQDIVDCAHDIRAEVVIAASHAQAGLVEAIASGVLASETARAEAGYAPPQAEEEDDD